MEVKIISEQQNPLFNRKEIQGEIKSDIAPSKQEILDNLSKKYSIPRNAIRILDIKGKFGTKDFSMRANVYPGQEERDNVEKLSKKEKESEAKASAPVEEEKPSEEPKTPAEETIGHNPVEEAKKIEEKKQEEDKKEKDKSQEEKLNETELQA